MTGDEFMADWVQRMERLRLENKFGVTLSTGRFVMPMAEILEFPGRRDESTRESTVPA